MPRAAPIRSGRCGALDILFEHQPIFDKLSRRSSDRRDPTFGIRVALED
jgi:hypothetical protein